MSSFGLGAGDGVMKNQPKTQNKTKNILKMQTKSVLFKSKEKVTKQLTTKTYTVQYELKCRYKELFILVLYYFVKNDLENKSLALMLTAS
jgi:hypothetical protein